MSAIRSKILALGLRRPFALSGHGVQAALAIRSQQTGRRVGQRQLTQGPPSEHNKRETKEDGEEPYRPEAKWVALSRITQCVYGMAMIYVVIMEHRRGRRLANEQREHKCNCAVGEVDAGAIVDDRIWKEE